APPCPTDRHDYDPTCIYKLNKDEDYLVASFDIAQTDAEILMSAIRKYLTYTTTIYKDKTN
ncbi:hypothetical protein, partial [Enterococcus faecalis]|uniref:hypothetical protein n=1 Tax=Enterococcus faecalis TaxID=1351 RepID=UPI003D6A9694